MLYERLDTLRRRVLVPPRTMVERNTYFLYAEVIFASLLGAAGSLTPPISCAWGAPTR